MSWWTSITSRFQRKADPTYPIAAQFFTPGQPIWTSKDFRSYVSQGYRRCGTVYTCINKIAGSAAGINWKLYTDRTMTREIPSHPILDLWHRPNPRMGGASFIEQVFGYWHLSGNAYIYANQPNPNEGPVELWPLRPDLIKIVAGDSDINGYVYGYGTGRARDFDPEQIMHLRFPSYDDEWYGLSPIEVAMELVDQQNEGNAWNTALMQNAGKPASVFFTKGYLTVEQRSQVRQELLKRYSGKRNAGTPLVLEADMTWQSMSMSPYELDWLQSRELNTRDIAAIFDVAPELVGDSAGKTFANQKEAKQSLYTENVLPKLDRVADHANNWLVPMYPDLAKSGAYLGYDRKDIEVLAEVYTAAQQQLSEQATDLWNSGQADLYTVQQMQGVKPDPNGKGIYKVGAILLRSQDLQAYAEQALQKPAAPPMPQAEPLNIPAPTNQPAQPTNEEPPDDENQNGKTPAKEKRRFTPDRKVLDLSSKEEKTAYAAKMEADRSKWETTIESRLQSYFDDERKAVVKAINACSTEDDIDHAVQSALSSQADTLEQLIYQTWMDVSTDIGGQVAAQLAGEKGILSDFIKLFGSNQLKYLLNIAGIKIKEINTATLARVRTHLALGVAQGESIPKLAKRIDSLYLDEIIPNRSAVIAHTEVISSSNWSSQQAAKQSGLTLNKVWLATEDGRTRPAHADADGQKVGMDEPFMVDGEELQYPGDPSGSAANIINCRCTQYYERVKSTNKVLTLAGAREYKSVRDFLEAMEA